MICKSGTKYLNSTGNRAFVRGLSSGVRFYALIELVDPVLKQSFRRRLPLRFALVVQR